MRTHYGLPSGDYTIALNKSDLDQLLSKGSVTMHTSRTGCTTSRACLNKNGNGLDFLDKKEVYNDLRFHLEERVADIEGGEHYVQFLNVVLDESCGVERKE